MCTAAPLSQCEQPWESVEETVTHTSRSTPKCDIKQPQALCIATHNNMNSSPRTKLKTMIMHAATCGVIYQHTGWWYRSVCPYQYCTVESVIHSHQVMHSPWYIFTHRASLESPHIEPINTCCRLNTEDSTQLVADRNTWTAHWE